MGCGERKKKMQVYNWEKIILKEIFLKMWGFIETFLNLLRRIERGVLLGIFSGCVASQIRFFQLVESERKSCIHSCP
jgi:hypothetical protein